MVLKITKILILVALGFSSLRASAVDEATRRRGFHKHNAEKREADIEREEGLPDYLRDQAAWEEKRKKDARADRLRKKIQFPGEDSPEYKADLKRRLADYEKAEKTRQRFVQEKSTHEAKDAKEAAAREAWAMEEYGLDKQRPRFDIAKRLLYGKPSTGATGGGSGGGFGNGSPGGFNGGNSFPDNNYNNEFDGYVPPPPFPDPGGYFPPPDGGMAPPPPVFPGSDDYYPPPPPPPQGFDNGF